MLSAKGSALRISGVSDFQHSEMPGTFPFSYCLPERQIPYTIQMLFRNAIR